MKRMNEVFELPVSGEEMQDHVAFRTFGDEDDAIAHAINNVDKLADALEALVSDYNQYRAVNEIDMTDDHSAKLHEKMATAEQALAAYRGAL
jgi:hypothetical protein